LTSDPHRHDHQHHHALQTGDRASGVRVHPSAYPQQSADDAIVLATMLTTLRDTHARHGHEAAPAHPAVLHLVEPSGRTHRVVISNGEGLRSDGPLTLTAFFGQKREGADRLLVDGIDAELMAEFPRFPALLSYNTLELLDGNFANLVLWSAPEGIAHFGASLRHAFAARELGPRYYQSIRIHTGEATRGLHAASAVALHSTRRFEYGPL
jgi:hypothetical protein